MIFLELKRKISEMGPVETREDSPKLFEFVLKTASADRLNLILEARFGPPLKQAHENASRNILHFTEPYGGIRKGRTFYYKENDASPSFVLIWPWNDGKHTTVKIFQEEEIRIAMKPESRLQRILSWPFPFG